MLKRIKRLLTNINFYFAILAILGFGTLLLIIMNAVIMPDYTNYDEGLTVPDITRTSLQQAEKRLKSYGLQYKVADRRSNTAYPPNYVIDQNPSPSEIVKPHRKIYLTVNTVAHPKVKVPKVVNLSLRNAEIQLENYGLKVGEINYESSQFKNSVLRQSIKAGKEVAKGTSVDLAVSDGLGQKMVTIPNIVGQEYTKAEQMLHGAGLRVDKVTYKPSKQVAPDIILSYNPKKGQVVEGTSLELIVSEPYNAKEEKESGAVMDTSGIVEPDTTNQ